MSRKRRAEIEAATEGVAESSDTTSVEAKQKEKRENKKLK
jgi:hypothetical protein